MLAHRPDAALKRPIGESVFSGNPVYDALKSAGNAAGAVGDGAEEGRGQRDHHARKAHAIAPDSLRRGAGAEQVCHVGREDEGEQQGIERLAGPVEEPPAEDPLAWGDHVRTSVSGR